MRYLLDTNIVSYLIQSHPIVLNRLSSVPRGSVYISAITYAEMRYGFAKNPHAIKRLAAFNALLQFIPILPFDEQAATHYGAFKAQIQQQGKNLAELDLQIAAHAQSQNMILITHDQAFFKINGLNVQDWTI